MNRLRSLFSTAPVIASTATERWPITLLPILPVLAWWALSFVFYAIGYPVPYTRVNIGLVSLLVSTCALVGCAAFVFVSRRIPREVRPVTATRIPLVVLIGAIVGIVVLVPWAETYSGYHLWQILDAVRNQGDAYVFAAIKIQEGSTSRLAFVAVQTVVAPVTMTVIPYTALAWFERRAHLGWLVAGFATLATMSLLVGRDFYIVLALMLVLAAWIVSRARRDLRFRWPLVAAAVVGVALFLVLFGLRKMSRAAFGGVPVCIPGAAQCTHPDTSTLWSTITVNVSTYASQSMEGLGRAFFGDWGFGGGYRHSPALTGIIESLFGPSPTVVITDQLTSVGWSDSAYWSTGLAQIANDVPWVLVPVVVGLMAAFLALAWRRSVRSGDWLSITVFGYGWFTMWFLMQNLQIATSGPLYVGFLFLSALFLAREVRDLVRARRLRASETPTPQTSTTSRRRPAQPARAASGSQPARPED